MITLRQALSLSLVTLSAISGCVDKPGTDYYQDIDESPKATEAVVLDAAVRVEQAERALDLGRDAAGAKATLEAVIADKDTPSDIRCRASMSLSRACEMLGDKEGAIVAIEKMLAAHTDGRTDGIDIAEARLRKLLTGAEKKKGDKHPHYGKIAPFARMLSNRFDLESKEPIEVTFLSIGSDGHSSEDFGTFNVGDALREHAEARCPACEDGPKVRSHAWQTGDWTSIPATRSQMDKAIVAFYTSLEDPIPARYDSLLPLPMADVIARLEKGEGFVMAKERKGSQPVILLAAPREAQLPEVEKALSVMGALPTAPTEIHVAAKLTQGEIKSVMRRSAHASIKECYESLLQRAPGVSGSAKLSFTIEAQGDVTNIDVTGTEGLDDRAALDCMSAAMKAVRFPATGESTTVHYPYMFTPGD